MNSRPRNRRPHLTTRREPIPGGSTAASLQPMVVSSGPRFRVLSTSPDDCCFCRLVVYPEGHKSVAHLLIWIELCAATLLQPMPTNHAPRGHVLCVGLALFLLCSPDVARNPGNVAEPNRQKKPTNQTPRRASRHRPGYLLMAGATGPWRSHKHGPPAPG